jgi:hypothetical protein
LKCCLRPPPLWSQKFGRDTTYILGSFLGPTATVHKTWEIKFYGVTWHKQIQPHIFNIYLGISVVGWNLTHSALSCTITKIISELPSHMKPPLHSRILTQHYKYFPMTSWILLWLVNDPLCT